jgi:short-subunit dehydrogenase
MKRILIVGATSAIAEATARLWAAQGHRLYLLGRNEERLQAMAADLAIRGAVSVNTGALDANDFARHERAIDDAITALEGIDIALIAHGTLGDQQACERDFDLALRELNTNALSVISLLTRLAGRFEAQGHGTIAVISSVAGDRGRQSNYVYGSAKGAVSIFLQGLRQRLCKSGVGVLTIKPGFVDTPMTRDFRKGPLWATPATIAKRIVKAIETGGDEVYAPGFWFFIMMVIKLIPERLFKRIKL